MKVDKRRFLLIFSSPLYRNFAFVFSFRMMNNGNDIFVVNNNSSDEATSNCFYGKRFVTWTIDTGVVKERLEGVSLGEQLLRVGLIRQSKSTAIFWNVITTYFCLLL